MTGHLHDPWLLLVAGVVVLYLAVAGPYWVRLTLAEGRRANQSTDSEVES
jgi:hypothetical protein